MAEAINLPFTPDPSWVPVSGWAFFEQLHNDRGLVQCAALCPAPALSISEVSRVGHGLPEEGRVFAFLWNGHEYAALVWNSETVRKNSTSPNRRRYLKWCEAVDAMSRMGL